MPDIWRICPLTRDQLTRSLFSDFDRAQPVDLCWRRDQAGNWVVRSDPFLDDWSEEDYRQLLSQLDQLLEEGGMVQGAFLREVGPLKGFVSVSARPYGRASDYRDMTNLHVSRDCRGQGLGKALFVKACDWARGQGAKKLYLSAHSAVETMAFYRKMGCVDAREPSAVHIAQEPFDCQLEYLL